jgi:hypothetical protein
MPCVVSTGTNLLCSGVRYHRPNGIERAHSLLAVPSKISVHGCSFAHERATLWAIIAARMTKMRGLLLDRRFLTPPRNKEGALWGRFPSPAPGLNLVRHVDLSTAVLVVTGGAGAHGE